MKKIASTFTALVLGAALLGLTACGGEEGVPALILWQIACSATCVETGAEGSTTAEICDSSDYSVEEMSQLNTDACVAEGQSLGCASMACACTAQTSAVGCE